MIERNNFDKSLTVYAKFQFLTRLYGEGVRRGLNLKELKEYILWSLFCFIDTKPRLDLLTRIYREGIEDKMNNDELTDCIIWELLYFIDCNSMLRYSAIRDRSYK